MGECELEEVICDITIFLDVCVCGDVFVGIPIGGGDDDDGSRLLILVIVLLKGQFVIAFFSNN